MDGGQEHGKPNLSQRHLEKLLRGQQKVESLLEDIQQSLQKLPASLLSNVAVTLTEVQAQDAVMTSSQEALSPTHSDCISEISQPCLQLASTTSRLKLEEPSSPPLNIQKPVRRASQAAILLTTMDSNDSQQEEQCQTQYLEKRKTHLPLPKVHEVFQDVELNHCSMNYSYVKEMLEAEYDMPRQPHSHNTFGKASAQYCDSVGLNKWAPTRMARMGLRRDYAIHPASRFCTAITIARATFLGIDAVVVPYMLAWDVGLEKDWALCLRVLMLCFWSVDVVLSFSTGYIKDDSVVMNLGAIARRYVRKGFAFDLLVVAVDFLDFCVSVTARSTAAAGDGPNLQAVKALRFCKITRLVRIVAKLRTGILERIHAAVIYWLQERRMVEFQPLVSFTAVIIKLLFVIAWIGHVGACIYYAIQRSMQGDESIESWSDFAIEGLPPYLDALYWSVCTMFSGASIQDPNNLNEVILSMAWSVMGVLFVTMITSSLAATLIDAQAKQEEMSRKARSLTAYLAQRKTPILLSMAINSDFHNKAMAAKPLTELDLPFLQIISQGLRAALRELEYDRLLLDMPVLRMLSVLREPFIKELAFASTIAVARDGDEMFAAKQEAEQALLLARGTAIYTMSAATRSHAGPPAHFSNRSSAELASLGQDAAGWGGARSEALERGAWLCEIALLVTWTTQGQLEANGACEVLLLDAEQFAKVATSNPVTEAVAAHYAVKFAEVLRESDGTMATDLGSALDYDLVAAHMDMSVRALMSKPVFDIVQRQQSLLMDLWNHNRLAALQEELLTGLCHLVIGPDGPQSILRVVQVVVLELVDSNGCVCVQLVDRQGSLVEAKLRLPGAKLQGQERPQDAVERLMADKLYVLRPAIRIMSERKVIEYETSASYGLRSKCIKTIFTARFEGQLEPDPTVVALASRLRSEVPVVINATTSSMSAAPPGASKMLRSFRMGNRKHGPSAPKRVPHQIEAVQSIFEKAPFDTEGAAHAFAVRRSQKGYLSESEASAQAQTSQMLTEPEEEANLFSAAQCVTDISVFRWMDPEEFASLHWRRAEAEEELARQGSALTAMTWLKLSSWRLRCSVSL